MIVFIIFDVFFSSRNVEKYAILLLSYFCIFLIRMSKFCLSKIGDGFQHFRRISRQSKNRSFR